MTEQEMAARIQQLEADLARVTQNRDSVLREKKELLAARISPEMAAERQRFKDLGIRGSWDDASQVDSVVVPRHSTPAEYRELKARAEQLGVPLSFTDDGPGDRTQAGFARGQDSRIKFVETDAVLFANKQMLGVLGVSGLTQEAQKRGKRLSLFRSIDDLPDEAKAKHARIEAEADPDSLVFGS